MLDTLEWIGRARRRLRALTHRRDLEREMSDEMRFHLAMETADLVRSGMPPETASQRARIAFGGVERFKEEGRDARGTRWAEDLAQDLRYAVRQLRSSPGFTAATVLTLTLGLGATTAMFSLINALLIDPLPFEHSDRLVFVRQFSPEQCSSCQYVAAGNYLSLRDDSRTLSDVAAMGSWAPALRGPDRTEVIDGYRVTSNFFRTLGVSAALGRTFTADDSLPGNRRVVVLSDATWRARFGGDSAIVGRGVTLDGVPFTVAGILPPEYTFPSRTEVWTILSVGASDAAERTATNLEIFGRLRPGATLDQARAEIAALGGRLTAAFPESMRGWRLEARPMREWHDDVRPALLVFLAAVAFVLLIACINLAGLLLARLSGRQREIAVRAAMGAGPGRIARQLLTETILLALVGGTLGVAFAVSAVGAIHRAIPVELASFLPGWSRLAVDGRALIVALMTAAAAGLLIGLGPAMRFARPDLGATLKEGARGAAGGVVSDRLRRAFVVAEVALSLILLSAAGLLVRSVANMYRADPGFRPDHVLTMSLQLPWRSDGQRRPARDFYDRLAAELTTLPGVEQAGTISALPMSHNSNTSYFDIEGRPVPAPTNRPSARLQVVTPGYFGVLRIPLVRGRSFTERDGPDAPRVVVVNQSLARRFFADEEPVGRALIVDGERYEVVGIAGDVFHNGVSEAAGFEIYLPQQQSQRRDAMLAVRTSARGAGASDDPALAAAAVMRAIRRIDPDVAINRVRTMDEVVAEFLSPFRVMVGIMMGFALIALLISGIGLYGVTSYAVAQRTREFGIRLALGAERGDVLRLVLGEGVRLAAVGTVFGLTGALALTRLMGFLLYGVGAADPITLLAVALALGGIALAASYVPAWRATRVDPMTSLRVD